MTRIAPPAEPRPVPISTGALERHALRLWPWLDVVELSRCGGDPEQIARLIAQRADLTVDEVTRTLVRPDGGEPAFYFG